MTTVVDGLIFPASLAAATPSLEQLLHHPYVSELVASQQGDRFAWVENLGGARNIWYASAGDHVPHKLTAYTADDGQDVTQLVFAADGSALLYVRGGDQDASWEVEGKLAPNPASDSTEPKVAIWSVAIAQRPSPPVEIAEGNRPALSARGQLAYIKDGQVWATTPPLHGGASGHVARLFFDRGSDGMLAWSPDGSRLAFVSRRDDHSFIGVYTSNDEPILYLTPSTHFDEEPVWSPDGRAIAFMRRPSGGHMYENFLTQHPHPFSLWIADASTGQGHQVWRSPNTLAGSLPQIGDREPLFWMADNKLVFMAEVDNWPHLYELALAAGSVRLLTPGNFMVEDVAISTGRDVLLYSANAGSEPDDGDRRHIFRLRAAAATPERLTTGAGLEWSPIALADDQVAYITAGAQRPSSVAVVTRHGGSEVVDTGSGRDFPFASLVIPKAVSFQAPDGLTIHGQLFRSSCAAGQQAAVIFVHGGPERQMLLGWNPMQYYDNAYAVNQYLAAHGFAVLSVNYRLGTGYGRAFQHPAHTGRAGAAEYQDVLAGARYLQHLQGVDPNRIGIWGGSYGGYLTGLALARNSNVFKAGVDFHGMSDFVPLFSNAKAFPQHWYQADPSWKQALASAFAASPIADIARWTSPVLLIQGDDDRNVPFDQTVELADRLEQQQIPFEELVLPNEIHSFLRLADWLQVDKATASFLAKHLHAQTACH